MPDRIKTDAQHRENTFDDDTPKACPHCGHNGAFDGHGYFTREFKRTSAAEDEQLIIQTWTEIHCPNCGELFALCDEEAEYTTPVEMEA